MLKDFFRNMFADDEEEFEDEYEEEEEVKTQPQPAATPAVPESDEPAPLYVEPEIQPANTYIRQSAAVQSDEKQKSFTGLDADDVAGAARKKETSRQPYRYDRSKMAKPPIQRQESPAYRAVISPIFGNMNEEAKQYDKVHDAINLQKPSEDFVMVQIISPMYGNEIPQAKPVEKIPPYPMNPQTDLAELPRPQNQEMDLSGMIQPESKKGSE